MIKKVSKVFLILAIFFKIIGLIFLFSQQWMVGSAFMLGFFGFDLFYKNIKTLDKTKKVWYN